MLIQSSFTDYYDYVRKTGVDHTITYKRETNLLKRYGREPRWSNKYKPRWDKKWIDTTPLGVIEFCGQLFYFAKIGDVFSYDAVDWEPLLKGKLREFHVDDIWEKSISAIYKTAAPVLAHFTEVKIMDGRLYERDVTYENPRLEDFSFGKVVKAQDAYQRLMMWFANKKLPPPIPHVDDKTMAEAKGFNKHSFRNSGGC